MKVLSVAEMQAVEKQADKSGISYQSMMQHAGQGVAAWVANNLSTERGVLGLVGSGNNGGDTLIALTDLAARGIRTIAFLIKDRPDDEDILRDYIEAGGQTVDLSDGEHIELLRCALFPGTVLLDGVLGTGLKLPLRGQLAGLMAEIKEIVANCSETVVVAVDCPSGVDCDTGEAAEQTLRASHTLVMAAVKQGLLRHPARDLTGAFHGIDIGIGPITNYIQDIMPTMLDTPWVRARLPERPENGHKGTFGACMVIAGSPAYTGAAYLAGMGAYRGGCGLVHMVVMPAVRQSLAGAFVEGIWTVLPEHKGQFSPDAIRELTPKLSSADSLIVGPGWGISPQNKTFLAHLLEAIPADLPTLFDADGIKLLAEIPNWWEKVPEQTILTPHPGEMAVLSGLSVAEIQAERWSIAKEYAGKWGIVLLLKGALSVIAGPDGQRLINPVSDSALAKAGSGDVLSGVIGGLLAQGRLDVTNAAGIGVWVHGMAGLVAKQRIGSAASVTARDILESIGEGFKQTEADAK
ncbi:MAG: NAD(P)H-hydrate dehydratase [Chloroflexota bacterium]|nr:NAD(P)H-hydrate dehydratase [Chloroflexota bacterium]